MNETGEEEELADPSPFTGPLQNVQWLSVYGTRSYATSHVNEGCWAAMAYFIVSINVMESKIVSKLN